MSDSVETTPKKKKRLAFDDDFFSLADRDDDKKKKKKKKKKSSHKSDIISTQDDTSQISDDKIDQPPLAEIEVLSDQDAGVSVKLSSFSPLEDEDSELIITQDSTVPRTRLQAKTTKPAPEETKSTLSATDESEDDTYMGFLDSIKDMKEKIKEATPNGYEFNDKNENNRPYLLQVIPKIEGAKTNHFKTKGTKLFGLIIKAVVDYYKKLNQISFNLNSEDFVFFWITGKSEISHILKPSSLRIPPPDKKDLTYVDKVGYTLLKVLLVPKSLAKDAFILYDELKGPTYDFIEDEEIEMADSMDELEVYDEFDIEHTDVPTEKSQKLPSGPEFIDLNNEEVLDPSKREGYFVISLKGKDGRRFPVRVHSNTEIKSLVSYYLKHQNIDENAFDYSKARVNFDDEDLDLQGKIGDTDIESDEQIHIFI